MAKYYRDDTAERAHFVKVDGARAHYWMEEGFAPKWIELKSIPEGLGRPWVIGTEQQFIIAMKMRDAREQAAISRSVIG